MCGKYTNMHTPHTQTTKNMQPEVDCVILHDCAYIIHEKSSYHDVKLTIYLISMYGIAYNIRAGMAFSHAHSALRCRLTKYPHAGSQNSSFS